MTVTILTVCRGNICRSPAMELLLSQELTKRQELPPKVVFASRGLNAVPHVELCTRTVRGLVDKTELAAFRRNHQPRPLTTGELGGAALVLAAGLEERAAVVRLSVAVRERTFTLIEAARLAEHVHTVMEVPTHLRGAERLTWLVEQMDASRGTLTLFPAQRHRSARKPWQTADYSDLDVPDAHLNDAVAHTVTRRRLEDATRSLGASIIYTLAPSMSLT